MSETCVPHRAYKVDKVKSFGADWIVKFFVDGETVGHAILATYDQADEAGVEFLFGGEIKD